MSCKAAKIIRLDETVVNRIAAGEIIQRPANAVKELIENSLDAKANNIQVIVREGGMKLLQIQDNGTGIRREDMEIVCERFTTSKLQKFEDLRNISTYGFRGEALASISHIAILTITTKTADEKCAYKATYVDSKLKEPPKSCAGNQGTIITIENLFYNVATRRKALSNTSEEFTKITEVIMKYAVHNASIGFLLKRHGETIPQIRTSNNSTKMTNVRMLYGNPIARELLEIELDDNNYQFKMHALITNPNYTSKRMTFLLFINNRLVESTPMKKMLEELYTVYLPKKTHPWCYISLEIDPNNVDVNVHPTKHEVRFLHEDSIIDRMKFALDEKLAGNSASRTFYLHARLPKVDVTKETLKEVLPEYNKDVAQRKGNKINQRELVRTDSMDQKLDKFNFTRHNAMKTVRDSAGYQLFEHNLQSDRSVEIKAADIVRKEAAIHNFSNVQKEREEERKEIKNSLDKNSMHFNDAAVNLNPCSAIDTVKTTLEDTPLHVDNLKMKDNTEKDLKDDITLKLSDSDSDEASNETNNFDNFIAEKARKQVYRCFGNKHIIENKEKEEKKTTKEDNVNCTSQPNTVIEESKTFTQEFKSYSINNFRREVKLTSVLKLRKEVEDNHHEGLREILANLTFVGCVDKNFALIQSGVNLYMCNTKKLAEELFYEIMVYDFANYGVLKFSSPLSLYELALLGLELEEAGWTEEDGTKEELATSVKELLLEKADMMKDYFSIVIDKKGYLKSLPILLNRYFPCEGGLPLYVLRLSTEVDWTMEQQCFRNVCRETARYFSEMNSTHGTHDWRYVTEHILYPAIKESLLPPKHFAHDSTILQIANLPDLYKVFERC